VSVLGAIFSEEKGELFSFSLRTKSSEKIPYIVYYINDKPIHSIFSS